MSEKFFLEIEWEVSSMPRFVGPFDSKAEAARFAELNVPNGAWLVARLSNPYREETSDADDN